MRYALFHKHDTASLNPIAAHSLYHHIPYLGEYFYLNCDIVGFIKVPIAFSRRLASFYSRWQAGRGSIIDNAI